MSAQISTTRPDTGGAARAALLIFLGAESVFFATLVMVYLYLRTNPGPHPFQPAALSEMVLPVLNTGVLLFSALAAWWGLRAIRQGNAPALTAALLVTLLLGLLFVAGQVWEFNRSEMRPDDAGFGGVFFLLVGFHALHVLSGVVVLLINLVRARLGDFDARHHLSVELGTWFWYYVTAVWVVLFSALYLV